MHVRHRKKPPKHLPTMVSYGCLSLFVRPGIDSDLSRVYSTSRKG